jgi:hypothetical protein
LEIYVELRIDLKKFSVHEEINSKMWYTLCNPRHSVQGRIQDFKLGGVHFKKLRRAEGGAKIFGVFRVKNHHFTQKKSYLFQF